MTNGKISPLIQKLKGELPSNVKSSTIQQKSGQRMRRDGSQKRKSTWFLNLFTAASAKRRGNWNCFLPVRLAKEEKLGNIPPLLKMWGNRHRHACQGRTLGPPSVERHAYRSSDQQAFRASHFSLEMRINEMT